jgi:hypothetical protein
MHHSRSQRSGSRRQIPARVDASTQQARVDAGDRPRGGVKRQGMYVMSLAL